MSNIFGSSKPAGTGSGESSKDESAAKSPFGAISSSSNSLFGNLGQKPASSGGFGAFGQNNTSNPSGSATGQGGSSTGWGFGAMKADDNKPAESPSFGNFTTPNKPGSNTGQNQTTGLFGNLSSNNNASGLSGSATPTTAKPQSLFGNVSTTPAGPPPSGSGGMFSLGQTGNSGPSLFGAPSTAAPENKASNSSSSASNLFGGQAQQTSSSSQPASGGLFGSNTNQKTAGSNLFGGQSTSNQGSTLFGKSPTDSKGPDSATTTAKPSPFAFPALGGQTTSNNNATPTTLAADASNSVGQSTTKSPFNIPSAASQTTQSPGQTISASAAPSLFSNATSSASAPSSNPFAAFGQKKDAQGSSTAQSPSFLTPQNAHKDTTTAAQPTGGLFGNIGEKKGAAPSTTSAPSHFAGLGQKRDASESGAKSQDTSAPASTTAQSSSTPAGPSSLFGSVAKPAGSAAPSLFNASAKPAETSTGTTQSSTAPPASNTANLGASTTGPAPSVQSRLKNKSMDEIITRWASDLSKYQKDFQAQADKVASWDRMLLENGNAISKLYSKTFQAERDTAEVEKQLSAVEGNQDELSMWLDRYEREIDGMMIQQNKGEARGLQGPDQERERTYKIAERVSEKLGDMGKDLTTIIEEINEASTAISKTSKADDPLSQIVRVLNGHLSQLQVIDQSTSALQAKVTAAGKESQRIGSRTHGILGNDAADDFYRSYTNRR